MTIQDKHAIIIKRFKDNFSTTPIAYENVEFKVDTDVDWVRLSVQNGDSNQVSMGTPAVANRFVGIIFVQIYTRAGRGTATALSIAQEVSDIWRNKQFDGITCRAPDINHLGVEGSWFQINVSCEFFYDEFY